ncbi:hypothetical protein [Lederbergia lenta]|uniref:hypothetical protein n=1 Tax=Lederbergia lenta TaxID=1467 RepID=UPI00203D7EAE|nr:hypothetical protein [Lederbergia lenta]MCM3109996.1 hypothetical protein [Lederbergia lenta]
MKIKIGCSVKDYLVGKGDTVIASWSLGFEGSACTVGKAYVIKDISPNKNLIIENDNGIMKEYSPLHFG